MPLDRGIIDQQLQELGEGNRWWDQREMRDLPAVLGADERILAIARGRIARVRVLRRSWLIIVTDRRLLCLRSAGGGGWRQVDVPAKQITRVALRIGPMHGRVRVTAGDRNLRLLVPRSDAYKLATALTGVGSITRPSPNLPGPVLMVRRVFDHVLALPAAALNPNAAEPVAAAAGNRGQQVARAAALPDPVTEQRIEWLEAQVAELQQQIDFLERLLQERHEAKAAFEP
ncbi:MAG TPA: PH domain-containing protein [Longimicrobiales bacterium]|nr:PH domain-containing protein [Longimicrobiales bacterium]